MLRWLAEQYPAFAETALQPGTGRLVPHVVLLVNGQRVVAPEAYEALLQDGDELVLLPSCAGGCNQR
ncbi:MAG: MoaD/ThiS family protein [Chloroflexi bacterium]|nr:MoaD/ThiS family protein [Chloroflexota bacterium]